jgi:hypothetical protein
MLHHVRPQCEPCRGRPGNDAEEDLALPSMNLRQVIERILPGDDAKKDLAPALPGDDAEEDLALTSMKLCPFLARIPPGDDAKKDRAHGLPGDDAEEDPDPDHVAHHHNECEQRKGSTALRDAPNHPSNSTEK